MALAIASQMFVLSLILFGGHCHPWFMPPFWLSYSLYKAIQNLLADSNNFGDHKNIEVNAANTLTQCQRSGDE